MQNPSDLYRFTADAGRNDPGSGVLVVALGAFIDAGQVQHLLSEHLVGTGHAEPVATFDVDQLFEKAVPQWMNIKYVVADLRRDALAQRRISGR